MAATLSEIEAATGPNVVPMIMRVGFIITIMRMTKGKARIKSMVKPKIWFTRRLAKI